MVVSFIRLFLTPLHVYDLGKQSRLYSSKRLNYLQTNRQKKSAEQKDQERNHGDGLLRFLDECPEPFNCVHTVASRLMETGFSELSEDIPWKATKAIKPGGRYFFTRNKSSIVAFTVGMNYKPGNAFKIIGAHTDSPNLKIKPNSKRVASGVVQLNVECYGGGIWSSWFDRELSLAGRVMIRRGDVITSTLLKIERPLLRIPSLCIHFRSADERENMKINKEDHLMPLLCDEVKNQLSSNKTIPQTNSSDNTEDGNEDTSMDRKDKWREGQSSELIRLIASELQVSENEVIDFELSLYDTQKACLSGLDQEYLVGARIDNLASCYVALTSFLDSSKQSMNDGNIQGQDINMIALFDHEEVGSESLSGAGSTLISDAISRTCRALFPPNEQVDDELVQVTLAKSFIISSDMAHAIHPNYASKHDKHHAPLMNGGIVIKTNVNQRYATNGLTGLIVRELGRKVGVPIQEFSVRNDCPCGSTIGPVISAKTGIRAVDIGMPQLSMHSIREMMGVSDLNYAYHLFREFFEEFTSIDENLK